MTTYNITNINMYANHGQNCEASLAFAKVGEVRKHDNLRWDKGSDIPELHISVKSAKFSLCAGGHLHGESLNEMLDDYFERVASTTFAYVTREFEVYEMNAKEFRAFLELFGYITRESEKNGGKSKIRVKDEGRVMKEWLRRGV